MVQLVAPHRGKCKFHRDGTNHHEGIRLKEQHLRCRRHGPTTGDHHVHWLGELVVGDCGHQGGAPQGHLGGPRGPQRHVVHQLVPDVPGEVIACVGHGHAGRHHRLQELGRIDGVVYPIESLVCFQVDEAGTLGGAWCCYGDHRSRSRDGPGGKEGG